MKEQNLSYTYDIIILGAGAAGLQCALTAAKRGRRVVLVEHNEQIGRKISISGGGKANFTNLHMGSEFYFGDDPAFVKPSLKAFPPQKIMDFYLQQGLAFEEREHGQLFGLSKAQNFVQCMQEQCMQYGCEFLCSHKIDKLHYAHECYSLTCSSKDAPPKTLNAQSLVLALGSSAYPQIGATSLGLSLAAQFGHTAKPFSSALAPFIMPKQWELAHLSGISMPVCISIQNAKYCDALLFTHTGVSGPAVLRASCHSQQSNAQHNTLAVQSMEVNFLPHAHLELLLDAKECGKLFLRNLVSRHMPQRLADALLPQEIAKRKIAELSRKDRQRAHASVHRHILTPQKKAGLEKAEAALGGIYTQEVHAKSMESRLQKNLFIVGELLDITGNLGGYNLHFAFASGHLAGLNA